jgi:CelD/BcsL family acetyltransferase involved in cellulose biosynthesis
VFGHFCAETPAINDISRMPLTPALAPYRVDLIDTADGLDALAPDWRRLADDPACGVGFFQSFEFARLAFGCALTSQAGRPLIAVARDAAGAVALILPLLVRRGHGVKIANWLGGAFVTTGDAIAPAHADIAAAGAAIRHRLKTAGVADLLLLRYVPHTARLADWLGDCATARLAQGPAPYLALTAATYASLYEARVSKVERGKRGRKRRRLAEIGPLHLDVAAATPAAVADLKAGLALKRAWVAERGLISGQLHDPYADALMLACASEHPGFECRTLRAGDELLNFVIALRGPRHVIYNLTVYNPAYERWSPGLIHLEDQIAAWMAQGLEAIDFGNGINPYKMEWTDVVRTHNDYAVALNLAGRAYIHATLHIAQPLMRRVYYGLSADMRRKALSVFKAITGGG